MQPEMQKISEHTTSPDGDIKVAIIEDLRDVREGLAILIDGTSGFDCVGRYRSVEEAIAKVGRQEPNIILTDIGLPGMDGYEVAMRLREVPGSRNSVVIALTGYGQIEDRRRSDAASFDGHLVKPVDIEELYRWIEACSRRAT